MRNLIKLGLVFIVGAVAGFAYDTASWWYQLPYIGFNWLGRLIGADGEAAYGAMTLECMIDFGLAFIFVFLVIQYAFRKFDVTLQRQRQQMPRTH